MRYAFLTGCCLLTLVSACSNTQVVIAQGDLGMQPGDVLSFGVVTTGMVREREVTLSNSGDHGSITLNSVTILPQSGEDAALSILNPSSEYTAVDLGQGESMVLTLSFAPTQEGALLARLSVVYYDGKDSREKVILLTGQGALPSVFVDPPVVDLGRVVMGDSANRVARVRNTGLGEVVVEAFTLTETTPDNPLRFSLEPPFGITLPAVLGAGSSMEFTVTYTADDDDPREASVDVTLQTLGDISTTLVIANDCARSADPSFDGDGDGVFGTPCGLDCDDANPAVHPGAVEAADLLDNNCNGLIDEGTSSFDDDGDCQCEIAPCVGSSEPTCTVLVGNDCNDGRADVGDGIPEILNNGIDDNCNGLIDEDPSLVDLDGDGFAPAGGDCDDTDPLNYPGNAEVADGADNDCDTLIDEGTLVYDDDGDCSCELGPCTGSVEPTCTNPVGGDCNDSNLTVSPLAIEEACGLGDGVDTDCDGVVDCGATDFDHDGVTAWAGDCDDNDPENYPGNTEIPDSQDNDCDGLIDEDTAAADDDGDGFCEGFVLVPLGPLDCSDGSTPGDCWDGDPLVSPNGTEGTGSGDGIDNDCNGLTDDGTLDWDGDGDGFTPNGGDCDDADAGRNPGVWDPPGDGIDWNCDGLD